MFEKLKVPSITGNDLLNQLKISLYNYYNINRYNSIMRNSSDLLKPIDNSILEKIDLSFLDIIIKDDGKTYFSFNIGGLV